MLGDLIAFAGSPPDPRDFGIVIGVNETQDVFTVMWSWDVIECSISAFEGERWGNLRVIAAEDSA